MVGRQGIEPRTSRLSDGRATVYTYDQWEQMGESNPVQRRMKPGQRPRWYTCMALSRGFEPR